MQKKLIALAIAGLSGAAFAQSNVTISGIMDMGYQNTNTQTSAATGKDSTSSWAGNGASTSNLTFSGTEALGNGLNAGFVLTTEFNPGGVEASAAALTAQAPFASKLMNSQNYLQLSSASWGSVKAGNINNASLGVSGTSQPFGTAIGSGYSAGFARLSRMSSLAIVNTGNKESVAPLAGSGSGTTTSGARLVRSSNSFMYDTPSFSGFSASLVHVFKNDNDQYASVGQQELGLKYNNGPINVNYAYTKFDGGSNMSAASLQSETVKHNMLGANYTFGPATVYGGWTSSKGSNAAGTTTDSRSWNLALKYAMGNWAFMANVLKADDKMVTDTDRNLTGLGINYSMSKRTTAYVRYENGDNNKASGDIGAFTRWGAGVTHSF